MEKCLCLDLILYSNKKWVTWFWCQTLVQVKYATGCLTSISPRKANLEECYMYIMTSLIREKQYKVLSPYLSLFWCSPDSWKYIFWVKGLYAFLNVVSPQQKKKKEYHSSIFVVWVGEVFYSMILVLVNRERATLTLQPSQLCFSQCESCY